MQIPKENEPSSSDQDLDSKLSEKLLIVRDDVQALLLATSKLSDDKIDEIRANITNSLQMLKNYFQENEEKLLKNSKAAVKSTDDYIHDHTWQAIGAAALFGFVLGSYLSFGVETNKRS
jgi:ElaB/YqjD/DUF883 family membrane-anchored ribosome-binding protein